MPHPGVNTHSNKLKHVRSREQWHFNWTDAESYKGN